jgi:hypothetical protein
VGNKKSRCERLLFGHNTTSCSCPHCDACPAFSNDRFLPAICRLKSDRELPRPTQSGHSAQRPKSKSSNYSTEREIVDQFLVPSMSMKKAFVLLGYVNLSISTYASLTATQR